MCTFLCSYLQFVFGVISYCVLKLFISFAICWYEITYCMQCYSVTHVYIFTVV